MVIYIFSSNNEDYASQNIVIRLLKVEGNGFEVVDL